MPRSSYTVLVILLCIASASGPASSQAPGPRPALSGTLNLLCTPQIVWCEGMKAEFQKVYPKVTVEFVRLSSGEALTRRRNERANPQFDIWWGGPIDSFIAAKATVECLASPWCTSWRSSQPVLSDGSVTVCHCGLLHASGAIPLDTRQLPYLASSPSAGDYHRTAEQRLKESTAC